MSATTSPRRAGVISRPGDLAVGQERPQRHRVALDDFADAVDRGFENIGSGAEAVAGLPIAAARHIGDTHDVLGQHDRGAGKQIEALDPQGRFVRRRRALAFAEITAAVEERAPGRCQPRRRGAERRRMRALGDGNLRRLEDGGSDGRVRRRRPCLARQRGTRHSAGSRSTPECRCGRGPVTRASRVMPSWGEAGAGRLLPPDASRARDHCRLSTSLRLLSAAICVRRRAAPPSERGTMLSFRWPLWPQ